MSELIKVTFTEEEFRARLKAALLADCDKDLVALTAQLKEAKAEYDAAPFLLQFKEREKFRVHQQNLVYLIGFIEIKKEYIRNGP